MLLRVKLCPRAVHFNPNGVIQVEIKHGTQIARGRFRDPTADGHGIRQKLVLRLVVISRLPHEHVTSLAWNSGSVAGLFEYQLRVDVVVTGFRNGKGMPFPCEYFDEGQIIMVYVIPLRFPVMVCL